MTEPIVYTISILEKVQMRTKKDANGDDITLTIEGRVYTYYEIRYNNDGVWSHWIGIGTSPISVKYTHGKKSAWDF